MPTPRCLTAALTGAALLSITALLPSAVHAGATQLLSRSDLASGDILAALPTIVTGNSIIVPGPYVLAAGGDILTFASGSMFDIQALGSGPAPRPERLYNDDDFTPDTITFAPGVDEFGFQGLGAYSAPYTFTCDVFNQSGLLDEFTVSGLPSADPTYLGPFIGARATGGDEITRVVLSAATGGDANNFDIGAVTYGPHATPPAVPEPSPLALLALGLLPIGLIARKRRRSA